MLELPIKMYKEIKFTLDGAKVVERHYVDVNGDKAVILMREKLAKAVCC